MSIKKEQLSITFADGTIGTITTETTKGRVDVKAEYEDVRVYYYTEKVGKNWTVKRCNDGRCYDTVIIADKETRKEAIAEIILDVRKNQVRTAYTYIIETSLGAVFEVVATSEELAKKCVRFKCYISEEKMHTKEIKKADDSKQQKAKLGSYADFIKQILPDPSDECPVENEEPVEVLDKAHEIIFNPLTELDVRISAIKSALNSVYGKQVIDAKNDIIRTELTGYHVSGVMTETGIMMLSCDIYAQDLDITESYLAYNVGSGYAVYDEISLTRTGIYADADAVKQFFVSRVKALETKTTETLY